jgi:hypothetical protein
MNSRHARWAALVSEFETSGLTTTKFCEQRDVGVSTLYKWRRRLAEGLPAAPCGPAFVEAVADRIASPFGSPMPIVELRCGRRVWIPHAFDEATLARLVILLERLDVADASEVRP